MKNDTSTTQGIIRSLIRTLIFSLLQILALFLVAGTVTWPIAWVYLGIFIIVQIIAISILFSRHPDLLMERASIKEGTKKWDLVLSRLVALVGPLIIWIISGLDKRFNWSQPISINLQWFGLTVVILGSLLTVWAMAANRFFSSTARIQTDRTQIVSTGGPYHYVRHPGYLGANLYNIGSPIALGSLWAFIPAIITIALVILRTNLEDKMLKKELPVYIDYKKEVRYRLLPGIW